LGGRGAGVSTFPTLIPLDKPNWGTYGCRGFSGLSGDQTHRYQESRLGFDISSDPQVKLKCEDTFITNIKVFVSTLCFRFLPKECFKQRNLDKSEATDIYTIT